MIREKLDKVFGEETLKGAPVPKKVDEKLRRGREAMMEDATQRRLCLKFWRGETNWFINAKGTLAANSVVTNPQDTGSKPPHRIRNRHNFIEPIVQGKVSQATQRTPSYQILSSTPDPQDIHAAKLAEQVAIYGFDKWNLRRATIKAVEYAIVTGEGFLLPYFDPNVGPFAVREKTDPETGEPLAGQDGQAELEIVGQGEMRWMVLFGNEVYWEPGVDFHESRWYAVERAVPIEEIEQLPGFVGGKIMADANTSDVPTETRASSHLALKTMYFERPCPDYPEGRFMHIVQNRVVTPVEPYPVKDEKGRPVDEPALHRISWTVDPESDRDRGLVWQIIDLQRTVDDCWNKLKEWKNRCLNPQMIAPRGANMARRDDTPGAVWHYNPVGGQKPEWERTPPIPQELFQMLEQSVSHMRSIAADNEAVAAPDLAAKTVDATAALNANRWQTFLADLAEWHSRVMRHYLMLVSQHYSEDRLIQIQGDFSPDLTESFRGADLRSQVNVRVYPQSLQPLTIEAIEARATNWATMGWISPPAAMVAINSGTMEGLMLPYKQNVGRISRVIGWIRQGPEVLFGIPERFDPKIPAMDPNTGAPIFQTDPATGQPILDPATGQPVPVMGMDVPGWMPREFDDVDVQLEVFTAWLGGNEFERLEPGMQEAGYQIYEALKGLKQQREMEQAMAQQQMAEGLGAANAAKPQLAKPLPDQPSQPNNAPPSQ